MKELATEFWVSEENSRVSWIYNQIEHYFFQGGCSHEHSRDFKFAKRKGVLIDSCESDSKIYENEKLTVLDVGSCYNPFKQFDNLDVLAIDIAPAQPDVFKCDFLKVNISDETVKTESSIQNLGRESFQVVVFCVLLEYMPTASQRYECVKKSVKLLSEDGLLCIVTPDSSHQGKKYGSNKVLEKGLNLLGLRQVTYDKTRHFHGLVFRKPSLRLQELTKKDVFDMSDNNVEVSNIKTMFFIPQDFTK